jgi:crossover junction endodeoxyribonuclease RusA
MKFSLPFPPSVNHYWTTRGTRHGKRLSNKATNYRNAVFAAVLDSNNGHIATPASGSLHVTIYYTWPDRRKRDLDNYPKGILDSLTHARVWVDDSQIKDLRLVCSGKFAAPGGVVVLIEPIKGSL